MRIYHIADTHLGYSSYRKISPETGINQREEDVYASFEEFVDIAVKERPDLIVHAGDLFNSVRPTNRAISFALKQILRISDAGIPLVIISGNHETPRLRETGSIFRIFEHVPEVVPVYKKRMERISYEIGGKTLNVFAVPHIGSIENFRNELDKMVPEKDGMNIAVLHGCIVGLNLHYEAGDFNEIKISARILGRDFDYIALGHYHDHTVVGDNCAYSGSTERFSFVEAGRRKGFLEVDIGKEREKADIGFRPLNTRKMLDLESVDAKNLDIGTLRQTIRSILEEEELQGVIGRLKITNVAKETYDHLDHNQLEKLTEKALYFQFNWSIEGEEGASGDYSSQFQGLIREFHEYMDGKIVENFDKERLKRMGTEYLRKAGVEE